MKEIIDCSARNPGPLSGHRGLDGKPKVRPFRFMLEDGGRHYFCHVEPEIRFSGRSSRIRTSSSALSGKTIPGCG